MSLQPILFVSDAHRPYHDRKAWKVMMDVARDLKPHTVAVIGDFADCYAISAHPKDPARALNFKSEITDVKRGVKELESLHPKRKIYVEGNHETRLIRYLHDKAPELRELTSIPELLDLDEWEFVPYRQHTTIGKLILTHDVGLVGRYAPHRTLDAVQHNIVTGHSHRFGLVVEGNVTGEAHISAQFGWLGDAKKTDYMHTVKAYRDWALGFGIGYLDPKTGFVYLVPVPIVNHTALFNGKIYKA